MDIDKKRLFDLIDHVHFACFGLCRKTFGKYLPVAGNVGIFCQSQKDFSAFTEIRNELAEKTNNPDQKYFRFHDPIILMAIDGFPATEYTHIYIRKPDVDTPELGDIDFVLEDKAYDEFKLAVLGGNKVLGARKYNQPGLDMIELFDTRVDSLGYVSTRQTADAVRFRINSELTSNN